MNSPKVRSVMTYQCGICDNHFNKNEEAIHHLKEVHNSPPSPPAQESMETGGQGDPVENAMEEEDEGEDEDEENVNAEDDAYNAELEVENEVMEEAAQDQEIYEELVRITQEVIQPENEEEIRKELKINIEKLKVSGKHQKYMLNQLRKEKAKWKDTINKQRQLEAENDNLKKNHEQVETFLQTSMNAKEAEVSEMTKKLKKAEGDHKKMKDQHKAALDTVHDTLGNVTKRNNDLKIEVAKQKSLITAMKEAKDREAADPEEDGSVEDDTDRDLEAQEQNHPPRVTMSKKSKEHRCHACDRVFNAAGDLDRHINDKHSPNECHMCNKKFNTRKQVQEHMCTEGDIIAQECEKSYCQKQFISSQALKNHMKTSYFGNQRFVCNKCGEIENTNHNLKKHIEVCGKAQANIRHTTEKSLEVCKHWRRGRCHWGSQCNFSHVGRQDTASSEHHSTSGAPQACWNGPSCTHLARGKCRFQHQELQGRGQEAQGRRQESQGRRQEAQGRRQELLGRRQPLPTWQESHGRRQNSQGARSQRAQCVWGRDCNRVPNCPHLHSLRDFPQYSNQHGFRGTNRPNNPRPPRN